MDGFVCSTCPFLFFARVTVPVGSLAAHLLFDAEPAIREPERAFGATEQKHKSITLKKAVISPALLHILRTTFNMSICTYVPVNYC